MPVNTLAVKIAMVSVLDDSDTFGAGEWHLHASVNGQQIGDPKKEFSVRTGENLFPPEEQWTEIVDVENHVAGDKIEIKLKIIEEDVFSDDNLGEVKAVVKFPYDDPFKVVYLEGPMLPGGWFSKDYQAYRAVIIVKHHDAFASTNTTGPTRTAVTRDGSGGTTFNTVRGETFVPRVDIHPVIPVPVPPSHVVKPLAIPAGLQAAVVTPAASIAAVPTAPTLNSMANPSVIPILSATDPDLANRIANISVTAYEPGNLDVTKFFWRVRSGPAVIVGANTGLSIQARGTEGETTDTLATFDLHWEDAAGPVLATYRAWVGKLGTLKYRVNILDGKPPSGGGATPFQSSTLLTPVMAHAIMQVVQAIVYQSGILLVPDTDVTAYEGATLSATGNAIFTMAVTNDQHTNNVNHNIISSSTPYNFRPGVINLQIVFTTVGGIAAAVDRNGIAGSADTGKNMDDDLTYTWNGEGVERNLSGGPSVSWIKPAGVGRDAGATKQVMKTINPTDRVKQAKKLDKAFVAARKLVDPTFTADRMSQLYSAQIPARWGSSAAWDYTWQCGVNFAHELCHVLGLAHRGSGGNSTGPSADAMDFQDASGSKRGHPWNENVMTYGYANLSPPLAHDIDLLQASVVRRHPAVTY